VYSVEPVYGLDISPLGVAHPGDCFQNLLVSLREIGPMPDRFMMEDTVTKVSDIVKTP
jgi:hypothetical protein